MKRILLILSCFSWTLQAMDSGRSTSSAAVAPLSKMALVYILNAQPPAIEHGSAFSPVPSSYTPLAGLEYLTFNKKTAKCSSYLPKFRISKHTKEVIYAIS